MRLHEKRNILAGKLKHLDRDDDEDEDDDDDSSRSYRTRWPSTVEHATDSIEIKGMFVCSIKTNSLKAISPLDSTYQELGNV